MSKSFGDKPGLNELMKKAQEMQKKMQEIQKQITEMEVKGVSGGGLVEIIMNGQHYAKRVKLNPDLLKEEISVIEDLILAAINHCTDQIEKGTREKMTALTGIKLPDDFKVNE